MGYLKLPHQLTVKSSNDFSFEVQRRLEKSHGHDIRLENHSSTGIPKILTSQYALKKNLDIMNYNAKKSDSRSHESLLDINEQIKSNQRILDLQNQLGVSIVQKNGQRKLGPPPNRSGPPPGPGCEVFVGRLPRNIYEDVIYPIFRRIGEIYELRLMMNFSGCNRGFCFIMYEKPEYAQMAIKILNDYQIQPGWSIGVVESVNNCRLHITHLPPDMKAKIFFEKIWSICEDIDNISFFTNISNHKVKHAMITYKTHRAAAMARRRLLPERNLLFDGYEIRIEWAHPDISINNVIDEKGYYDENGSLITSMKAIKNSKKSFYNEHSDASFWKSADHKSKNHHSSFVPCNLNLMKNQHKEMNLGNKVTSAKNYCSKDSKKILQSTQSIHNCVKKPQYPKSINNLIYNDNKNLDFAKRMDDYYDNSSVYKIIETNNSKKLSDYNSSNGRSNESESNFFKNTDSDDLKNVSYRNDQNNPAHSKQIQIGSFDARNYPQMYYTLQESLPKQKSYTVFKNNFIPLRNLDFNCISSNANKQPSFGKPILKSVCDDSELSNNVNFDLRSCYPNYYYLPISNHNFLTGQRIN